MSGRNLDSIQIRSDLHSCKTVKNKNTDGGVNNHFVGETTKVYNLNFIFDQNVKDLLNKTKIILKFCH